MLDFNFDEWDVVAEHTAARESISFNHEGREYNVGEKLALVHSEISEALEAYRTNMMDTHLPDRPGIEVELADAVLRIMGMGVHIGLDIRGAIMAKAAYNDTRADHKPEARGGLHGKRF